MAGLHARMSRSQPAYRLFLVLFYFFPLTFSVSSPRIASATTDPSTLTDQFVRAYNAGNYKRGVQLLRKAMAKGYPRAYLYLGRLYLEGKGVPANDQEGARLILASAKMNFNPAQLEIGELYEKGRGVPQDYAEAAKWYTLAAKLDHRQAPTRLALLFQEGKGVTKDYSKAAEWYRISALENYHDAQIGLAALHVNGLGVKKDNVEGYAWYLLGAQGGNKQAVEGLKIVGPYMTTQQTETAKRRAVEIWTTKMGQKEFLLQLDFSRDLPAKPQTDSSSVLVNLGALRVADAKYFVDHDGYFPINLADLGPLLDRGDIPPLILPDHVGTNSSKNYGGEVCRKRPDGSFDLIGKRIKDSGRWGYVNDKKAVCYGMIFIDCTHKDDKGKYWYQR